MTLSKWNLENKMSNLLRLVACLFLPVSLNSFAIVVDPFSEIRLDHTTSGGDFFVQENTTFTFTDSGGVANNYGRNENSYITFSSNNGLRLSIHRPEASNYFDFEKSTYSQYDRLGIQVSNSGIAYLQNFQSSPESAGLSPEPWLQTSLNSNPPWSRDFGGPGYFRQNSQNGYIFPADTYRGEELGLIENRALDLPFTSIRFYFYSDTSSVRSGWDFEISALAGASPVPLPAGITLFLSGLVGLGLMRGRNA